MTSAASAPQSGTGTWAVVATVAEPAPVVCAFLAHHLRLGAAHAYLFLDRGDAPDLAHLLAGVDRCTVTLCDAAYWRRAGGRPILVTERQKINAQAIYDACPYPWLLHADADEYLSPHTDLAGALANAPGDSEVVRLPVAERVRQAGAIDRHIFEGAFRLPLDARRGVAPADVFGRDARYLNQGVKAYAHFKSLARTGRDLRMGIHTPLALDEGQRKRALTLPRPALFHYEGLTPKSWVRKMHRKAQIEDWRTKGNKARARQLRVFASHRVPARQLLRLYDRLDRIDAGQARQLASARALSEPDLALEATARALFPGAAMDFSVTAFDRAALVAPEDGFLAELAALGCQLAPITGPRSACTRDPCFG